MKKVLLVIFGIMLSMHTCFAEVSADDMDEENIFTDDTPAAAETINGYIEYNEGVNEDENTIFLKEPININNINLSAPKKIGSKSLIPEAKRPTFQPMGNHMEAASKFYSPDYSIRPLSTSYSEKFGNFSFGTSYDSFLSSARPSNSTGIFAKYNGKHFTISTIFSKSTNNYNSNYGDSITVVPELKLTKRLSLLDEMETDVYQISKSNEIILRYTPHFKKYADDVQLEVGAGQSFYNDSFTSAKLRFSTKFKL